MLLAGWEAVIILWDNSKDNLGDYRRVNGMTNGVKKGKNEKLLLFIETELVDRSLSYTGLKLRLVSTLSPARLPLNGP